jgi:Polyphosphate kinase 2 (PPK2)
MATRQSNEIMAISQGSDPPRQWKLSPMDIESYDRWYDYSRTRHDARGKPTANMHRGTSCARMTSGGRASTAFRTFCH